MVVASTRPREPFPITLSRRSPIHLGRGHADSPAVDFRSLRSLVTSEGGHGDRGGRPWTRWARESCWLAALGWRPRRRMAINLVCALSVGVIAGLAYLHRTALPVPVAASEATANPADRSAVHFITSATPPGMSEQRFAGRDEKQARSPSTTVDPATTVGVVPKPSLRGVTTATQPGSPSRLKSTSAAPPVPHAPTASPLVPTTTPARLTVVDDVVSVSPKGDARIDVLANDVAGPGEVLAMASLRITASPGLGAHATVSGGRVVYSPVKGQQGVDTFTYSVCTLSGACGDGRITVTVSS